jgi:GNAT superfamily N-acetyltransferase
MDRVTRPLATSQELLFLSLPMPLRPATVWDVDAMHAVRVAVRENALSDENRVLQGDYRAMLQESGRGWGHDESKKVVAFGIADHAHRNIWALFVAPGFEGQGIGRGLLDVMVTWLFAQGRDPVWLTTGRNTRAEHFYSAAGWRAVCPAADGEIRFELTAEDFRGRLTHD